MVEITPLVIYGLLDMMVDLEHCSTGCEYSLGNFWIAENDGWIRAPLVAITSLVINGLLNMMVGLENCSLC